jgi:glycosyltransferase involved in cell wall biosynthesis
MTGTVVHYVDSHLFGGAEQAMVHLACRLARKGWRQTILHEDAPGLAPLLARAEAAGIAHRIVPSLHGLDAVSGARAFLHALDDLAPDVFHAHLNWPLACSGGLALARLRRIRAVVATVQLYGTLPRRLSVQALARVVPWTVHRYVAVSRALAGRLTAELGVESNRIHVIPNGVDAAASESAAPVSTSPPAGRPVVLCVARLEGQKGLFHLIEAASGVPEATFLVAGDGPDRESLERHARELRVVDRVRFLGFRTDVPALLAGASVIVLPSLYEGLPLSVLEAMAAARPVVATRIPGTDEAVADGVTGVLVPPADPAALAAAIRALVSDPERARQMGDAGRRRVLQEFDASITAGAVDGLYRELLRSRTR